MSDRQKVLLTEVSNRLRELSDLITDLAATGEARDGPKADEAAPKDATEKAPEEKRVTRDDIVKACQRKFNEGKRDAIDAIARKYGIEKISNLEDDDLADFLAEVEAIH